MKNNNRTKNTKKKLKKSAYLKSSLLILSVLIVIGIIVGLKINLKRKADKTVKIAFYMLNDELCGLIKNIIPHDDNIIVEYDVISEKAMDLKFIRQKYDMIFTWRGDVTDSLYDSAEEIPSKILENIPVVLRDKKCAQILLDHCELAYSTKLLNSIEMNVPETYTDFINSLSAAKSQVFSPFFCNGAENRILVDFIGSQVLAKGGLGAYIQLIKIMRKENSLYSIIDVSLDENGFTLRSVLENIKGWPQMGYTHPLWYNGKGNDLKNFAEDGQIGVFFTLLSEHRKIPYNIIKNFESTFIPTNQNPQNYGVISPAVSCMLLSDNSNCKRFLAEFYKVDVQTELSNKTKLAPVHYRARAFDSQADDVRFWAASCAGGAVPDIYLAVYQRKSDALEKMAAEIRNYMR